MAGHIAHDLNNLITPLLAYPSLVRRDLPEGSYGLELLSVIEKAAKDMVHVTRQLQGLVRRSETEEREEQDLNSVVECAVGRVQHDDKIDVRLKLLSGMPRVKMLPDEAGLAVEHLLMNAFDAMDGVGGVAEIETRVVSMNGEAGTVYANSPPKGTYAVVVVRDSGDGVPGDNRERIFDPCFTTRKGRKKRGSGFGLTIAYRIMCDHDGYVGFESREGAGSVFSLYFPVNGATAVSSSGQSVMPVADKPNSAETKDCARAEDDAVLLVDDEKSILQLFRTILVTALPSCRVDTASNGAEAVGMFSRAHHKVVVMDLHMPVMDGHQAFLEIQRLCGEKQWEMPAVVFCTGFAPPDSLKGAIARDSRHFILTKPVTGDKLVETVSARLGPRQ